MVVVVVVDDWVAVLVDGMPMARVAVFLIYV